MTTLSSHDPFAEVIYPESDGLPMAENTIQFEWIVKIEGGLDSLFAAREDVFVAGDLFWYPVQGDPRIRVAPDALVVFGRPKGHRSSYLQWNEGGIAPQVVFEVRSPGNSDAEMTGKHAFYERHRVEEYYLYDPDEPSLEGWRRTGTTLDSIPEMQNWVSPRLGIRFDMSSGDLIIYRPDGEPFATYLEVMQQRQQARDALNEVSESLQETQETLQETQETLQETQETLQETQEQLEEAQTDTRKARDAERTARDAERKALERANQLAAKLRDLGLDPDA